jgi:hypothetical protein
VVIYPTELTHLKAVLESQDPSLDSEDGHPIACAKILEACQSFEYPPVFYCEDCPEIVNSKEFSVHVPLWMNTASQVSTGNRRQVREDGADVLNSSDSDSETEERGDVITGMYTSDMLDAEGKPKRGDLRNWDPFRR